jgi:hypothetical protein
MMFQLITNRALNLMSSGDLSKLWANLCPPYPYLPFPPPACPPRSNSSRQPSPLVALVLKSDPVFSFALQGGTERKAGYRYAPPLHLNRFNQDSEHVEKPVSWRGRAVANSMGMIRFSSTADHERIRYPKARSARSIVDHWDRNAIGKPQGRYR